MTQAIVVAVSETMCVRMTKNKHTHNSFDDNKKKERKSEYMLCHVRCALSPRITFPFQIIVRTFLNSGQLLPNSCESVGQSQLFDSFFRVLCVCVWHIQVNKSSSSGETREFFCNIATK